MAAAATNSSSSEGAASQAGEAQPPPPLPPNGRRTSAGSSSAADQQLASSGSVSEEPGSKKKTKKGSTGKLANKTKQANSKSKNNNKKCNKSQAGEAKQGDSDNGSQQSQAKPRCLVEELTLFQNNHLLNQQDPLQQLHQQLNQLVRDDDIRSSSRRTASTAAFPNSQSAASAAHRTPASNGITTDSRLSQHQTQVGNTNQVVDNSLANYDDDGSENIFTLKKGVLWQQQNYDKFHQRLFNRWKKRYFILTTDYLVCFKRSSSKVGHSEMGKFLYKTALSDVTKITWLKPKKSDKGAIVINLNGPFNLFLWSKKNLEDWMFMISESVERIKIRRSCIAQQQQQQQQNGFEQKTTYSFAAVPQTAHVANHATPDGDLYENTANVVRDQAQEAPIVADGEIEPPKSFSNIAESADVKSIKPEDRSNTITKHSRNSVDDPPLSRKLRSSHRSGETSKNRSTNDCDQTIDPEANGRNDTSGGGKSLSQSIESSGGERTNLIERGSRRDNVNGWDEEPSGLKEPTDTKGASEVQRSGMSAKPIMINDASNNDGRRRASNGSAQSSNVSPISATQIDRVAKCREPNPTARDNLSSESSSERKPAANGSVSNTETAQLDSPRAENELNAVKANRSAESKERKLSGAEAGEPDDEARVDQCNSDNAKRNISPDKRNLHHNQPVPIDIETSPRCETQMNSKQTGQKKTERQQQHRPATNLIRRDDSWQSLVSLTRVGKVTPAAVQVAQRSLYAQHIMPDINNSDSSGSRQYSRQHGINIESTITPSRGPFLRQQSIQLSPSQRKLRPLLPGGRQHAASFDVAPNSPMQPNAAANQQGGGGISYQQKLLQLQLLHNSNNVDYIRNNGGDTTSDYQIYGPESATYHYGYSSMRSNLKSATSEFSFIRPSAFYSNHNATQQSTLPHHQSYVLDNQGAHQRQPIRSSLILAGQSPGFQQQQSDNNNNDIHCFSPTSKQFLVNPMTGERIINQQSLDTSTKEALMVGGELAPPMRELPLKPNKKRAANGVDNPNLPKSSSLTSSIACFFRRAFSRRSKRASKQRSKLAESCSSSLGAFEDGFTSVPVVPSAFSTGSKSVNGRKDQESGQPGAQSQRMVDIIEAFTNKTRPGDAQAAAVGHFKQAPDAENMPRPSAGLGIAFGNAPKMTPKHPSGQPLSTMNQFGSPLHKSNSISATMGLSLADANGARRALLYDNEMLSASGGGVSPLLIRQAKVMSANLTPLMSQREPMTESSQHQFFLSPRNSRPDHLPRPSSIYGQPSMISSPMITRDEHNNFGALRNSMHNPSHFRDRNLSSGFEMRRHHQMMKAPFLDTTREVAEEISSPTAEFKSHDYEQNLSELSRQHQQPQQQAQASPLGRYLIKRDNNSFDAISASPSSGKLNQQHQRHQAVVNPILQQSPTTNTIYDNHPMLQHNGVGTDLSSYSHYDNHNQLLMDQYQRSPSLQRVSQSGSSSAKQFMASSEMPAMARLSSHDDQYAQRINISNLTPLHHHQRPPDPAERMMLINKKPSAIVAPSTPNHSGFRDDLSQTNRSDQFFDIGNGRAPALPQSRSPMLSRRAVNQSHYQQSPLVSQQTRVLNKGDGVQATIIGSRDGAFNGNRIAQPVINIAGAPGINLEPSLAASLLRGTNIDAYESSTFERQASNEAKSNSKTFLVATRLSKSMAYNQAPAQDNGSSNCSVLRDEMSVASGSNNTTFLRSSRDDELSSSGSRSMKSSVGRSSLRAKVSDLSSRNRGNSQEDAQEESSGSDTHGSKQSGKTTSSQESSHSQRRSSSGASRRRRRESSSEPSDNLASHVDSLDNNDERNWITSKLVE